MKRKTALIIIFVLLLSVTFGTLSALALLNTEEAGMKFDGLSEYETDSVSMELPLTYEATLAFPADYSGEGGVIYGSYTDDKTAAFSFEIGEGGSPRLKIIDADGVNYGVTFESVSVYSGERMHVAITLDRTAGRWSLYVNGRLIEKISADAPGELSLSSVFCLGGDNTPANESYFKGELFGVALYSDLRSAKEIALDSEGGEIATDGLTLAYSPLSPASEEKAITALNNSAYNLTHRCEWVKDAKAPESYDYSFAVIGDIQSMTYYYPERLVRQLEWIRDNKDENKIAFSVGLGDITEKNTAAEYLKVIEAYDKIDGLIPFSIIRGNHERTSDNSTLMFDTYINQERYGDEITGSLDESMHNTYRILQIGRVRYMFMNLDLTLTDEAISWANEVIAAHPECHVVLSTHVYKNMGGSYLVLDGKFGAENNPEDLWNELISQHENIVMVLYGHSPKDKINVKQREGVHGNTVTEMLINPSETDKRYGGGGFVAMFYFSEDGEKLDVRYYSAIKEAYFRSDNQFSLVLDTPGTVEDEYVTFSDLIMNVGADESERNLTWYSERELAAEVRYGKSTDGKLPSTYSTVKAVGVKASKPGYYSYKTTLVDIEANSSYVYQLVVGNMTSELYSFNTYGAGDDFSFAFITDAQVKEAKHADYWDDTLEKLKNQFGNISLIVSAGDQTSEPSREDNFDWFISDYLSSMPIATTVGPPHDNSQLYRDHYNLPNPSSTYGISTPSSDYFYTYGSVLYMHLNVENKDYAGHIRFIENAIEENPDCLWRIVVLHYSFFTGGNHSTDGSVIAFREAMGGKFSEMDIDVVLSGHDHVYTRSQMMKDGYTLSGDTVSQGTVTDPEGTLYICGASSTGSGWYNVEHHDDDAYIAVSEDRNRKSVVIFKVSEGALTLKTYFVDGTSPELYDSFTIKKSVDKVRINKDTDLLEVLDGGERIPLVNAYAYTRATVRVMGGYWALTTDGGESYKSLGVKSTDTLTVLKINDATGIWELSTDGGVSYKSLGINTRSYTVKFVDIPGAAFGDMTNLAKYAARRFSSEVPDGPALFMPKGSVQDGRLNNWRWEYYLIAGDGTPTESFEYGRSYVAYPVSDALPIASTVYIGAVSNPAEYTYTWLEAWDIVHRTVGESITLKLKSDITLTAADAISAVIPLDLTLDLGGHRLDTSALAPAIKLGVGSNGSHLTIITSAEGGTLYAGVNDFIELGSNQGSTVTVQFGSPDEKPLTVESIGYLVGANGNFKYTSTLNLSVYNGSYTVAKGVVYVSNVKAGASYNIYKLDLIGADFKFSGKESAIIRSKAADLCANAKSYVNAVGSSFTDVYKANHTSSRFLVREDRWYGSLSFVDCDFLGMAIGCDYTGAALVNPSAIFIGKGCTFKNSSTTFNKTNPPSFSSEKAELANGCVLARTDAAGGIEVLSRFDAIEISWANPIGYKDYWKAGAVPSYLGETSLTVGSEAYTLRLSEQPTAATENRSYAFVSAQGYLFRYESSLGVWQMSTDGGSTYVDLPESGYHPDDPDPDPEPDPEPEPEPDPGCTVRIEDVSTVYPVGTDFRDIIAAVNVSANANKEINITLSADMSVNTAASYSSAKNSTLNIDLAGHKLSFSSGANLKISNGYTLRFFSSLPGGELVFATTDDGIQPGTGTIVFGSETYKNNLTVTSEMQLVKFAQVSSGAKTRIEYLYSTVNMGSYGLLRLNAKGAGAVTVEMNVVGCTVIGSSKVVCYNSSSTLGATSNGGVFTKESYINATDTSFIATAEEPVGFFSHANFADRYFGTASFEGCTFKNYILNGDIIYSDEALDYNAYYDTLSGTGYDPTKAVTVGGDCVFVGYGDTFNEDATGFTSANVSLKAGCYTVSGEGSVTVYDSALHPLTGWRSEDGYHWKECTGCNDGVKFYLSECDMDESKDPAVCKVCGAEKEEPIIPTPGHTYVTSVTPPTCTEKGYTTYTCTTCGESYVDNYVTASGHSYGDWSISLAPSCTADGERTKTCIACGATIKEKVAASGHTLVTTEAKAPTCEKVGWEAYEACTACDYSTYSELEAIGHDYSEADCETAKTCKRCGKTDGAPLGHDYSEATCEAAKTCKICGKTDGTPLGHDYSEATCEAAKVCKRCGKVDGAPLGHDWLEATTEAPKTCQRCGKTEGDRLPSGDEGGSNTPGDNTPGTDDTPGEDKPGDEPSTPEDEHKNCGANPFAVFWNAIVNFFRRLFGMPALCVCGKEI